MTAGVANACVMGVQSNGTDYSPEFVSPETTAPVTPSSKEEPPFGFRRRPQPSPGTSSASNPEIALLAAAEQELLRDREVIKSALQTLNARTTQLSEQVHVLETERDRSHGELKNAVAKLDTIIELDASAAVLQKAVDSQADLSCLFPLDSSDLKGPQPGSTAQPESSSGAAFLLLRVQNKLELLEALAGTKNEELARFHNEQRILADQVQQLQKEVDGKDLVINSVRSELLLKEQELKDVRNRALTNEQLAEDLRKESEELHLQVEYLESACNVLSTKKFEMAAQVASLQSEVTALTSRLQLDVEWIDELQGAVEVLEEQRGDSSCSESPFGSELAEHCEELEAQLEDAETQLDELYADKSELMVQMSSQETALAKATRRLSDLQLRVHVLQHELLMQEDEQVAMLEAALRHKQAQLEQMEAALQGMHVVGVAALLSGLRHHQQQKKVLQSIMPRRSVKTPKQNGKQITKKGGNEYIDQAVLDAMWEPFLNAVYYISQHPEGKQLAQRMSADVQRSVNRYQQGVAWGEGKRFTLLGSPHEFEGGIQEEGQAVEAAGWKRGLLRWAARGVIALPIVFVSVKVGQGATQAGRRAKQMQEKL